MIVLILNALSWPCMPVVFNICIRTWYSFIISILKKTTFFIIPDYLLPIAISKPVFYLLPKSSLPIKTNQLRHYFISLIKMPGVRFGQGDMPESQLNSFSIVLLSPLMLSWTISFIFGLAVLSDIGIHKRKFCASVK